jgi:hypothetical protein
MHNINTNNSDNVSINLITCKLLYIEIMILIHSKSNLKRGNPPILFSKFQ